MMEWKRLKKSIGYGDKVAQAAGHNKIKNKKFLKRG